MSLVFLQAVTGRSQPMLPPIHTDNLSLDTYPKLSVRHAQLLLASNCPASCGREQCTALPSDSWATSQPLCTVNGYRPACTLAAVQGNGHKTACMSGITTETAASIVDTGLCTLRDPRMTTHNCMSATPTSPMKRFSPSTWPVRALVTAATTLKSYVNLPPGHRQVLRHTHHQTCAQPSS